MLAAILKEMYQNNLTSRKFDFKRLTFSQNPSKMSREKMWIRKEVMN